MIRLLLKLSVTVLLPSSSTVKPTRPPVHTLSVRVVFTSGRPIGLTIVMLLMLMALLVWAVL